MNDASPQTAMPAPPRTKDRRRSFLGSGARRWLMVGAHPAAPVPQQMSRAEPIDRGPPSCGAIRSSNQSGVRKGV